MHAKIHVLKLFVFQCVCMTQDNVSVLGHKAGEFSPSREGVSEAPHIMVNPPLWACVCLGRIHVHTDMQTNQLLALHPEIWVPMPCTPEALVGTSYSIAKNMEIC